MSWPSAAALPPGDGRLHRGGHVDTTYASQGTLPSPGTPRAFAAFVSTETAKFGRIIKQARVKENGPL
jgi:hypothetical protein